MYVKVPFAALAMQTELGYQHAFALMRAVCKVYVSIDWSSGPIPYFCYYMTGIVTNIRFILFRLTFHTNINGLNEFSVSLNLIITGTTGFAQREQVPRYGGGAAH